MILMQRRCRKTEETGRYERDEARAKRVRVNADVIWRHLETSRDLDPEMRDSQPSARTTLGNGETVFAYLSRARYPVASGVPGDG
jgi:hypothetical protein